MVFVPRLLVFDLDGTLIDSRRDLTNSVNAMLLEYGRRPLSDAVVSTYIGDGANTLVKRAMEHQESDSRGPLEHAPLDEALACFLSHYRTHMLEETYVYPGVLQSLSAIRRNYPELQMAVLTNKPVGPSQKICRHFELERFFFANYGGDSFATKKPEPEGLLKLMEEAGVLPHATVMVGDSHVDVGTARACGARSLGCRYGLSPESLEAAGPDLSVASAAEWPAALGLRLR